jgi:hypothetical protein
VSSNAHRIGRAPVVAAALVIIATLLGPALAASAAKTVSKSTTTTTTASLECTAAALSFTGPEAISPQAGGQEFLVVLTNVSSHSCQVHGFATVRFYTSAGRLLTFVDKHSSQYFHSPSPRLFNLAPHAHAYFEVAKSRCDTGNRYLSSFFYVLPPYTAGSPWVGHVSPSGVSEFAYCKGSSRGPGQVVGVSPIVSSPTQLG